MNLRDRVVELRRVPAGSLLHNPKNWRTHPKAQREVLKGLYSELGFVDPIIARKLPTGELMILDGHLRREELDAGQDVPVVVVDLSEEEAAKFLATADPLTQLAGQDDSKLIALLDDFNSDNAAIQKMLGDLVKLPKEEPGPITFDQKFEVLVTCEDEAQQAQLLERLLQEGFKCRSLIS